MTSVGALICGRLALRLPEATTASICRAPPSGQSPRPAARTARARSRGSSSGKPPFRNARHVLMFASTYSSALRGGGARKTANTSGAGRRQRWIAGRRHDRSERPHPLGPMDRQFLRDHAAHRSAHDMGSSDPEEIEQADRVGRHVPEQIGRRERLAGSAFEQRLGEVGRQAHRSCSTCRCRDCRNG